MKFRKSTSHGSDDVNLLFWYLNELVQTEYPSHLDFYQDMQCMLAYNNLKADSLIILCHLCHESETWKP